MKKIGFYASLMVISGFFGYLYEVFFYFMNSGFTNIYSRGICFLPIIDIYVIGGLLIYILNKKNPKWYLVFIKSGLLCGALEYIAGYLIYTLMNGKRSWDYNNEILNFGNINGFICLRSVLFFAISGVILMKIIIPLIKKKIDNKFFVYFFITIFCLFILDESYNLIAMFSKNIVSASDIYRKLGVKYMTY